MLIAPVMGNLPVGGRPLSELPLDPAALTGLDYILVSHAHYDHCDKASLRQLAAAGRLQPRELRLLAIGESLGLA